MESSDLVLTCVCLTQGQLESFRVLQEEQRMTEMIIQEPVTDSQENSAHVTEECFFMQQLTALQAWLAKRSDTSAVRDSSNGTQQVQFPSRCSADADEKKLGVWIKNQRAAAKRSLEAL